MHYNENLKEQIPETLAKQNCFGFVESAPFYIFVIIGCLSVINKQTIFFPFLLVLRLLCPFLVFFPFVPFFHGLLPVRLLSRVYCTLFFVSLIAQLVT